MRVGILILCLCASAFSMRVAVKELLPPDSFSENYLVLVSSGEVLELSPSEAETLSDINWAIENNEQVEIDVKESRVKSNFNRSTIETTRLISLREETDEENLDDYIPTPLDNYNVASAVNTNVIKQMFLFLRKDLNPDSQCYNRAQIWVHDLATKFLPNRTINLGKMWLFFTKRYIREFNYKWWFHVSPYTYLKGDPSEIMLDRTYHHSPRRFTRWKNMFMKNNAPCTEVKYYSHYNNNQEAAYCYTIKSSMYYYQPYQIENLEKGHKQRRGFLQNELELAYKDALR